MLLKAWETLSDPETQTASVSFFTVVTESGNPESEEKRIAVQETQGKKNNNFFQIILFSFILEAKLKLESICPAGEGAKDKVSLSFSDSALNCVE